MRRRPATSPPTGAAPPAPRAADAPSGGVGRSRRSGGPVVAAVIGGAVLLALGGLAAGLRGPALPLPDLTLPAIAADPSVAAVCAEAAEAVRRAPDSAAAWGELGLLLVANGADDGAVACFREAAQRDRRSWRWPFFAAATLARRDWQGAVAAMDDAVRRDPHATWPRLLRAEWLAALGRTPAAVADFEAVLSAEPRLARARLGLTRVLVADGAAERALDRLGPAWDDPTTRRASREVAASVAIRRGDATGAETLLAEAAALPPDTPGPDDPLDAELVEHVHGKRGLVALVERLERGGALERAGALTRRLEKEHRDVWLFVEGRLCVERGDLPAAERAFREALRLDPSAIEIRSALADVLRRQGRSADVVAALEELLRLEPAHGPAWLDLGRALLPKDRPAALAALRTAVAYMPASEEARRTLATAESDTATENDRR